MSVIIAKAEIHKGVFKSARFYFRNIIVSLLPQSFCSEWRGARTCRWCSAFKKNGCD